MSQVLKIESSGGDSTVLIDRGSLARLSALLEPILKPPPSCFVLVTDRNVEPHHGAVVQEGLGRLAPLAETIVLEPGESTKNPAMLMELCSRMAEAGVDRGAVVVALGGGVVSDLAGFAASVFKRGIPFVAIPTTLLAQVDAAIGGKTGIDLPQGKNLVGTFHQPTAVLIDPDTLVTLPDAEWRNGAGEVLKYGLLDETGPFDELEPLGSDAYRTAAQATTGLIARCAAIKVGICNRDGREQGERMRLNLGHTLGHALEAAAGFERLRHGEAVALGLVGEAVLAARLGLAPTELSGMIEAVCLRLGLAIRAEGLDPRVVESFLAMDKKNIGRTLRFALPVAVGRVELVEVTDPAAIRAAIAHLLDS